MMINIKINKLMVVIILFVIEVIFILKYNVIVIIRIVKDVRKLGQFVMVLVVLSFLMLDIVKFCMMLFSKVEFK